MIMTLNTLPASIYHALQDCAAANPDNVAFNYIYGLSPDYQQQCVGYAEFFAAMCQSARLIKSMELERVPSRNQPSRPVVSFLLPNIPQAHSIMWGAESVGVINPLNPLLSEDALLNLMQLAQTDVVFALGPNPHSDIWEKSVAVVERLEVKPRLVPVLFAAEGYCLYEDLLLNESGADLPAEWLPGLDDIASYFHTGGTTGLPKLAQNTHRNQLACVELHHRSLLVSSKDKVINGLPLFHVAGSMINGLACLCAGMEIILPTLAGFRNPAVVADHWRMVERFGITISGGIPTSVASILDVPLADADISSLRFLISGGSPVPASLCVATKKILDLELYQIYGMTECAGGIAMPNIRRPTVPGCAGYVDEKIEVMVQGAQQVGDSGELLVRGDVVFAGYLGVAETPLQGGWLHTGDLGHIDADGYLFIAGRAKDLIIRSGHNIDPALIENCLEQHPAVSMAAAVGRPDSYAGELPVAYVQLFEGAEVTVAELMGFVRANIAERPACPKAIDILPELPITAVGKVHKPSLRAMSINALFEASLQAEGVNGKVKTTVLDSGSMKVFVSGCDTDAQHGVLDLAAKLELPLEFE